MPKIPHARKRVDMSRFQLFFVARSGRLVPTKLCFDSAAREEIDVQRLAFGCMCLPVVSSMCMCTPLERSRILMTHQGCRLISRLDQ